MSEPLRVPDDELDYDENLIYTWHGELFTGTAFENGPDGVVSEVSYVDGSQQGPARDLTADGRLIGEDTYHENARHGLSREFDADGRLVRAAWYEYNILVRSAAADASGELDWRDEVSAGSAEADLLDRWRRELHWPTPEPSPSAD
ncbi:toxin-antitoxin system YwqK family antitoxin [Luteimicrobium sp. DT211]|uniref:toxin-antitoxin system YwqK family antitoxin n=1 Tax=Luteimicrobium sp. DT211 TaxID=3393412 RepID=UPI003CF44B5D